VPPRPARWMVPAIASHPRQKERIAPSCCPAGATTPRLPVCSGSCSALTAATNRAVP
jgi:hypothetical protein